VPRKSPGPCGFKVVHIKHIFSEYKWFYEFILKVYNELIHFPERCNDCKNLY